MSLFNDEESNYHKLEKIRAKKLAHIQDIQHEKRLRRLRNFARIIQYNPNVYWPAVFRFVSRHKEIAKYITYTRDCTECFLTTLLEYGCNDLNIVRWILKLYSYRDTLRTTKSPYQNYIRFMNQLTAPLGSDAVAGSLFLFGSEMTEFSLRYLNLNFLRGLVKYGLFDEREINFSLLCKESLLRFWDEFRPYYRNASFNGGSSSNGYCRGARRITCTINIIRILAFHLFLYDLNFFKTYMRVTTEPLITKEDIIDVFRSHFSGIAKDFLADRVRDYERHFPAECATDYEPRTLKHLCRVQIRRHIVDQGNGVVLPEAVVRLPLPKKLQNYLLCLS